MSGSPSREELEAARCWEADDHVPGRPAMTDCRRRLRYHRAQWREAHGHPIGTQPILPRPGAPVRPVGSRLPLDYGRDMGASFLTAAALAAARERIAVTEPYQSFDHQRLWADLLSSAALTFNLFGDLSRDLARANRAVHTWWPDAPGTVCEVRFAHSPGRPDDVDDEGPERALPACLTATTSRRRGRRPWDRPGRPVPTRGRGA